MKVKFLDFWCGTEASLINYILSKVVAISAILMLSWPRAIHAFLKGHFCRLTLSFVKVKVLALKSDFVEQELKLLDGLERLKSA